MRERLKMGDRVFVKGGSCDGKLAQIIEVGSYLDIDGSPYHFKVMLLEPARFKEKSLYRSDLESLTEHGQKDGEPDPMRNIEETGLED